MPPYQSTSRRRTSASSAFIENTNNNVSGFNGIVFGGGGGATTGFHNHHHTPQLLSSHQPTTTSDMVFDSTHSNTPISEHILRLQREASQLRSQNKQLAAVNDARQKAALAMLQSMMASGEESSSTPPDTNNDNTRGQLIKLLVALLGNDTSLPDQQQQQTIPEPVSDNIPPVEETAETEKKPSTQIDESYQPEAIERKSGQYLDWDIRALSEVADQGKIDDSGLHTDKYAAETRKAIGGARSHYSLTRRRTVSLVDEHGYEPPSSMSSAFSLTQSNQPHLSPDNTQNPVTTEEYGPLAESLLHVLPEQQKNPVFSIDPQLRFMIYSASTGVIQAKSLGGLRSGDLSLADIIEAASRPITLNQLRQNRSVPKENHDDELHISKPTVTSEAAEEESQQHKYGNAGCFWIDVTDPTPGEMNSLARVFGIHPLTVEDIMTDEECRDKFESFGNYHFIVYRTADYGDEAKSTYEFNRGSGGIPTASFSIVLKQSCVLTFHRTRGLEHLGNVVERLSGLSTQFVDEEQLGKTGESQPSVITAAYIAYALVDDITDALTPEMRSTELEVDTVDELVLILSTKEQSDMLKRIGAARSKILTIWRLLQGKPEVIRAFSKLMERQAMVDEMIRSDLEEMERAKSLSLDNANDHFDYDSRAAPSPVASGASPQTTLRRSTQSVVGIHQLAGSGTFASGGSSMRRKDNTPLWPPARIHAVAKDKMLPPSTRPSTLDLPAIGNLTSGRPLDMAEGPVTADEVAHYLSDVHDHLVSLLGSTSHCDMVLSRAHSNYLARISLELGETTVETNMFASRWTVIGAILVPLNVVTGLWGMNVKVPGQDSGSLREFFIILAGCLAFVATVMVWARYKKIF